MKRLRPHHLALLLALLVGGCKHDASTTDPSADGPEGDGGSSTEITPDASEAFDRALEANAELGEATQGPRERDKPADPKTRDAALVAAAHGNPEGAALFLAAHLEAKPDDHEAGFALARAQRLTGRLDAAEATLEAVRRHSKDDAPKAEALRRLAHARELRGDIAGAEALIRSARKLAPDNLLLQGELVRLSLVTGTEGEREIRELVDGLYAAYADGAAVSAEELLGASSAARAERAFKSINRLLQEAEAEAPPSGGSSIGDEIAVQLAGLFLEKYKPGEAAQTLAQVLERDPWNPEALAMMSQVALDEFRLAEASRLAEESLLVNPENIDAHTVLAWVAMIEGRRAEARRRVEDHVLKINPSHTSAQIVVAALAIFERDDPGYRAARDAVLAVSPVNGRFFSGLGDLLGYLHLYPESDAVLSEGAKRLPDDPYVLGGLGLSRLRLGDEAGGRAALDRAWKRDKYNARTRNVRELYREHIEPDYAEQRHGDLTLRVPTDQQEIVAPGFVDAIQRARGALDKAYGIHISPLRVEMFAEPETFSVRTVGVPSLGAVGVCFGPVITSIGPYAGTHNFNQVIWHEIAHSYAIELSAGRVPRWFTEGLSEWESEVADPSWARESASLLFEARRHGKLRKLSELELAFLRAESPLMMEVAYSTAAWAMRYLGETYGREKIVAMLRGYAKGESTEALAERVLGRDMSALEADFEAWFDAELDRKLSGWRPDSEQPDDPRLEALKAAMEAAGSGDFDDARTKLETMVGGDGDGYQTRMMLAGVCNKLDDHKAALGHYERAAKYASEELDPLLGRAQIHREQGDVAAELDVFEAILAIDAMSLEIPVRMMVMAGGSEDWGHLKLAVDRADAIAPLHPTVLAGGVLWYLDGRGKKAKLKPETKAALEARLDAAMVTALRPDASMDVVVMTALAADAMDDPRVADLAPRALESKELPEPGRKRLKKRVP